MREFLRSYGFARACYDEVGPSVNVSKEGYERQEEVRTDTSHPDHEYDEIIGDESLFDSRVIFNFIELGIRFLLAPFRSNNL